MLRWTRPDVRHHAQIVPSFWTGATGKALRGYPEAQTLALFLITCPAADWLGLYYLSMPTIVHETGLSADAVATALARLAELDFAHYDAAAEVVWLPEMARHQIAPELSEKDNRRKGVINTLRRWESHPFHAAFLHKYGDAYHLEAPPKGLGRGLEGAWKGLHGGTGSGSGSGSGSGRTLDQIRIPSGPTTDHISVADAVSVLTQCGPPRLVMTSGHGTDTGLSYAHEAALVRALQQRKLQRADLEWLCRWLNEANEFFHGSKPGKTVHANLLLRDDHLGEALDHAATWAQARPSQQGGLSRRVLTMADPVEGPSD